MIHSHTHRVFGACVWEKNDEWLVLFGTHKNHVQTLKSTQNATIESLKLIYIFNERERARAHTLTQTRNNIIDRSTGRQPRVYIHEWNVITNVKTNLNDNTQHEFSNNAHTRNIDTTNLLTLSTLGCSWCCYFHKYYFTSGAFARCCCCCHFVATL